MKKLFEKIVSIATAVIGVLFTALLLVVMFGGLDAAQMDNQIVQALLLTLAILFAIMLALNIILAFRDTDKLTNIILFKDKESATKATLGVVKSTAKKAAKQVEGAKLSKIRLIADENGNIRLKMELRIKGDNVDDTAVRVRATVEDAFESIFGVKFHYIDINLVHVKTQYVANQSGVDARVKQLKASITDNRPSVEINAPEPLSATPGTVLVADEEPTYPAETEENQNGFSSEAENEASDASPALSDAGQEDETQSQDPQNPDGE